MLKFVIFRYRGNRVGLAIFLLTQAYWLTPIPYPRTKNYDSYLTQNRSNGCLNFYHYGNRNFFVFSKKVGLNFKLYFSNPNSTSLRGTASFEVLSVNVCAGVSAVDDWKCPKRIVNMRTSEGVYFASAFTVITAFHFCSCRHPHSTLILGCSSWTRSPMLGSI